MAMIIDAFVSTFVERLSKMIEDEVGMLLGVEAELKKLERKLRKIQDVLQDAERKAFYDNTIRHWVAELKEVMYDADDIIDDCRIEAEKHDIRSLERQQHAIVRDTGVCCHFPPSSCFSKISFCHKIGNKIRSINARLEEISNERSQFQLMPAIGDDQTSRISRQTSPVLESDIVGMRIDKDTNNLVELLTNDDQRRSRNLVFAIVGMGGIGKTTLAQKVYDNEQIKANFQIKIWVCVSKEFEEIKLLKEIISGAGRSYGEAQTRAQLEPLLREVVEQKKCFIVLDDVWSMHVWEDLLRNPLQSAANGSRILATTRDARVAWQMGAVHLQHVKLLSVEDGWSLLCKKVFPSGEEEMLGLRDIGVKIVEKCNGLPLAIKTIAGVLRTKIKSEREWGKVLSNPAWTLSELPEGIIGALYLSYEDLPSHLKQCFAYCSLFPEDYVFMRTFLGRLWVAEGFIKGGLVKEEELAYMYFKELVHRNLLQPHPSHVNEMACKMHDLVRALAQFVAQDENSYGDLQGLNNNVVLVKPRRISVPADRELVDVVDVIKKHDCLRTLLLIRNPLKQVSLLDDLFKKLRRLRVLDLSDTGISSLPNSVGKLMHLKHLKLNRSKIRELPQSIERLVNLQFLMLDGCQYLHSLPVGITKLHNLSTLQLRATPLDHMPAGIGKLEHLNALSGFVASSNDDASGGSTLEELGSLPLLKYLQIVKLELASSRAEASVAALRQKSHLVELGLYCTLHEADGWPYIEDEVKRLEMVFEELCPPPCLESLDIRNFFGRDYPSWMSSSAASGVVSLTSLRYLVMKDFPLCQQLPALGQLPNLTYFSASGLPAVTAIGPEFLGSDNGSNIYNGVLRSFFPKLEIIDLTGMDNLEEWRCEELEEEEEKAGGVALQLLPCLIELYLNGCPKLKSLPERLLRRATNLTKLVIIGAHTLRAIGNLTSLKHLEIRNNPNLESISNLPALGSLFIYNCPALNSVGKLDALWFLDLTDDSIESLPDWLGHLGHHNTDSAGAAQLHKLQIQCKASVLRRCLRDGGPDWPTIQNFPHVYACTKDKRTCLTYTKSPFSFTTNLPATA